MSSEPAETGSDEDSTGFELKITGRAIKRALIGLLAAAVLGGLVFLGLFLFGSRDALGTFVSERNYQAVFLADGRVYFGHLRDLGDEYYELRDVFYVQQVPGAKKDDEPTSQIKPRSSDLHGPEGRMLIPKVAVSLIENIRRNAELSKTIDRLLKEN